MLSAALLRYDSSDNLERGSAAITNGGGRRRASAWLYAELTEPMLVILDVDRDLECPLGGPPALPPVDARALLPACLTLSVLIWR